MDWKKLLFGFGGRINRAKYWLTILIYGLLWVVYAIIVAILMGGLRADALGGATGGSIAVIALMVILVFVGLWSSLAAAIKRLHDRNKSGWWILLFGIVPGILNGVAQSMDATSIGILIALIGASIAIWGFVEIGCLKGTTGPNDYGPDPIG
jgi:uncharacterized membrane protein YhaH (DUF805 family)